MGKEKIIPKILNILQSQAEATASLFDILTSDYISSYRKAQRVIKSGPQQFKSDWAEKYKQHQRFYSLLNKLKNEGLIQKRELGSKKTIWKITKKGLDKLAYTKKSDVFVAAGKNYEAKRDYNLKIIIFDVPEKERRKRDWLRAVLLRLGFSLLQQSVWIGKNKVPEKFLIDLKNFSMLSYVHIFTINQKGTIEENN